MVQARLGHDANKPQYFEIQGVVQQINYSSDKPPWYKAIPQRNPEDKAFKVEEQDDGKYFCQRNGQTYDSYTPR